MIYVIDIDGTICNDSDGNYKQCSPFESRIVKINELYDQGNTIIYQTARGMDSCNGDQVRAYKKYYHYTYNQLLEWNCKFHELFLGKPKADYYIDDKMVAINDFFNKS